MPLPRMAGQTTVWSMKRLLLCGFALLFVSGCIRRVEEKTTITWWQFWTDPLARPVIEELVATFEAENPDIAVNLVDLTWAEGHQKIVVAFAAGTTPDVLELGSDWVAEFSHKGLLLDLTAEAERQRDLLLKWEPVTHQGRTYGFPWLLGTRVLFYNKDLLFRAQFDPEKPPENWADWLTEALAVDRLGSDVHGFAANAFEHHRLYKKFLPFFWSNGGRLLSEDGDSCLLASPQGVDALEFYVALCGAGLIETQRELDLAFLRGKVGFTISGDWLLDQLRRDPDSPQFGVALLPRPEGGQSISFAGGEYLVIPKKSAHAQEAQLFINFLLRPENNLKLCRAIGFVPAHKAAAQNPYFLDDPFRAVFYEQLASAQPTPVHPAWVEMEEEVERAVEAAMYGAQRPDSALRRAARAIDEIIGR